MTGIFLRATVVTRGWNGYRNKSQHRKSTLEKKILPPFQQGFEPATFQSRVRCSNHWAIPAPLYDVQRFLPLTVTVHHYQITETADRGGTDLNQAAPTLREAIERATLSGRVGSKTRLCELIIGGSHKYHFVAAKVQIRVLSGTKVCFSPQDYVCLDKSFVATNICRDKHNFIATKLLSQQAYFCRDKHVFVATKLVFCRDKTFVSLSKGEKQRMCIACNKLLTVEYLTATAL